MIIKFIISLIPVFLFLVMLLYLDSLNLVNKTWLSVALVWGVVSAGMSFLVNTYLIHNLNLPFETYSRYIAPLVEESLKFSLLLLMIRKGKIGFMIDGAIYGFSIGAAFAFCENLFYLFYFTEDNGNIMIWITRGLGTALMHSGTTAIFAVQCMSAINRQKNFVVAALTGAIVTYIIHGIFNQFLVSPIISTIIILVITPVILIFIFQANEKSIRNWLEMEFDSEAIMIKMIKKGRFSETKAGAFLVSIKNHFPAEVVVDMYCFISLYLELSMKAKTLMMLRENDLELPPDPEIPAKLAELRSLEKAIGKAGYLAIMPILRVNHKDLWKLSLIGY
jgi:RsiW-degrading membrane proteinase PrsW (M82 family)